MVIHPLHFLLFLIQYNMVLYLFRRHVSKLVFVFFKTINFSFFFLFSPARCQPLRAAARTVAAVRRARWRNSNRSNCWQSLPQRPPISHARTRKRWPAPRVGASSGYRRYRWLLRRPADGRPRPCQGETRVASQHSASPRAVAPWMTRSKQRRS